MRLPGRFEVHELAIIERFSRAQENERVQQELLNAIHGSGAFQMFRSAIRRLGLEQTWHQFRDEVLQEMARSGLAAHNLPYK